MIKYTQTSIIKSLPEYGVLVHPVNCAAKMNFGMMQAVSKQFKDWYANYRGYCRWFIDGHQDEILGTFHRFQTDDNRIVCSFFSQKNASRDDNTDYQMWYSFLRKIEKQTKVANDAGQPWELHIDERTYSIGGVEDLCFKKILEKVFACSSVILWIHTSSNQN